MAALSLVLTTHDALPALQDAFDGLDAQSLLPAEILITDRGSHPSVLEFLHGWRPPPGVLYKVLESPGASVSVARNLAIEAASYPDLAVIDDSVVLDSEWLAILWTALQSGCEAVTGVVRPAGTTVLDRAIGDVETRLRIKADPALLASSSRALVVTRAAWDGVGGYPEWLDAAQDAIFATALADSGAVISAQPDAVATWNPRLTVTGYLAWCYRVSRAMGIAGLADRSEITRLIVGLACCSAVLSARKFTPARLIAALLVAARAAPALAQVCRTRHDHPDSMAARLGVTAGVVVIGAVGRTFGYSVGLLPMAGGRGGTGEHAGRGRR